MDKKLLILIFFIFFIALLVVFARWRTGNVFVEFEESSLNVGDKITGEFIIDLNNMDSINKDSKIVFILSDDSGSILFTQNYDLNDFISYETKKIIFDMGKNIDFVFEKKGEYEANAVIFEIDYFGKRKIFVN